MTFDDVLGTDYRKFQEQAPDRLVPGPTPCTRYWAPDYRKITDINVRRAIALAYPTRSVDQGRRPHRGRQPLPGRRAAAARAPRAAWSTRRSRA